MDKIYRARALGKGKADLCWLDIAQELSLIPDDELEAYMEGLVKELAYHLDEWAAWLVGGFDWREFMSKERSRPYYERQS